MLIQCSICGKYYDTLKKHDCNTQETFRVTPLDFPQIDLSPKTCTCGSPSFMDRIFGRPGYINSQCPVHGNHSKSF